MNKKIFLLCFCLFTLSINAQPRPKLVVGIVVDQMRWDYLYRFSYRFDNNGFKRVLAEGFSCENASISHIPSFTAVGHATIYTGSVPSIHGIASNDFYDRLTDKHIYCTEDNKVFAIGSSNKDSKSGKMSPKNLKATTITDELKLATNFRSKVIAISLKDRGSILPGGHTPDGVYWFEAKGGNWITSSFYTNNLPQWVKEYNNKKMAEKYLSQDWNTLYPIDTYLQSTSDNNNYEEQIENGKEPVFPILTSKLLKQKGLDIIKITPYGNTMTFDMAKLAVENEHLGKDSITDFLAISLSSTDYIGHQFGVNSVKTEDCYLRLDKDLGAFLLFLDQKVGKNNYTVFITSDHGGEHNGQFLIDHNLPGGSWNLKAYRDSLNNFLFAKFGVENIVKNLLNYQVNFNYSKIKNLDINEVKQQAIDYLQTLDNVQYVVDMKKASVATIPEPVKQKIINGYNHRYSGEIQIVMQPGWYGDSDLRGATHGSFTPNDTHIPLLFMGWGINHGKSRTPVSMCDIAPSIAFLLNIQYPSGCIGNPITDIYSK